MCVVPGKPGPLEANLGGLELKRHSILHLVKLLTLKLIYLARDQNLLTKSRKSKSRQGFAPDPLRELKAFPDSAAPGPPSQGDQTSRISRVCLVFRPSVLRPVRQ